MSRWLFVFFAVLSIVGSACAQNSSSVNVTVFINDIDYVSSKSTLDIFELSGFNLDYVRSTGYRGHMQDPVIFILGGQNAPQGVGDIVSGILTKGEKDELSKNWDARRVFVVPNLWREGQKVIIFAGHGKEQTRQMVQQALADVIRSFRFDDSKVLEGHIVADRVPVPDIDYSQPFTEVSAPQAKAIMDSVDELTVFDVRGVPFYMAGHIPGSINLPARDVDTRLGDFKRGRTYLLYCGGNSESIYVGHTMAAMGFKKIYRLVDGYVAYRREGYPKATGKEPGVWVSPDET